MMMKHGEDKSRELNKNSLLLYAGQQGDAVQFSEFIQRNIQLYSIRNGHDLKPAAVAHFVRREMADALRTRVILY
jgi:20S proteasome subunit beta 4